MCVFARSWPHPACWRSARRRTRWRHVTESLSTCCWTWWETGRAGPGSAVCFGCTSLIKTVEWSVRWYPAPSVQWSQMAPHSNKHRSFQQNHTGSVRGVEGSYCCSSGMKISVFSFLSSKSLPLWPLLCLRLCRSLPSWRWTCWSPASPTSCCGTPTTLSTNRASALTHRPPGAEDAAKADHAVRHQNASTHSNTH